MNNKRKLEMNELFTKVKGYLQSISKLTLALFIALLGVVVVVSVYGKFEDFYRKKNDEKYEKVKEWSSDLSVINLKATAKTKVVDGQMLVSLVIDGYPEYFTHPQLAKKNQQESFVVAFSDEDNFEIFQKRIQFSEFSTNVDASGKPNGLSNQFSQFIDTSKYEKFSRMKILWTFDTQIPKVVTPTSSSKPLAVGGTDHCAPRLSRAERLKRLAMFGTVRETGKDTYSAGGRSVMLGWDGGVIYCN
jgi:hypothetical protein